MGLTCAARTAGVADAATAVSESRTATVPNVHGSVRAHLKQQAGDGLPHHQRDRASDRHALDRERERASNDHPDDFAPPRAKRHADSYLTRSLTDQVGQHSVNPDGREKQRQHGKTAYQLNREPARRRAGGLHLAHRPHRKRRQVGIDGSHGASERHGQQRGIAARSDNQPHRQRRDLRQRPVDHRAWPDLEVLAQHVAHHADDRHPRWRRARRPEVQAASNGILSRKVPSRGLFVDHRHGTGVVRRSEYAPLPQRNSHQGKVVRRNDVALNRRDRRRLVLGRTVDGNRREVALAIERNALDDGGGLDAWQLTHAAQHFVEERQTCLVRVIGPDSRIVWLRQPEPRRQHAAAVDAGVDVEHARKAPYRAAPRR